MCQILPHPHNGSFKGPYNDANVIAFRIRTTLYSFRGSFHGLVNVTSGEMETAWKIRKKVLDVALI